MKKLYIRNPHLFAGPFARSGFRAASFDKGAAILRKLNLPKFMDMRFPSHDDWEALVVNPDACAEYKKGDKMGHPSAVYPAWTPLQTYDALRSYCKFPVGEDLSLTQDESIPPDMRPVPGQPHKVILYNPGRGDSAEGMMAIAQIEEIHREYPDVEFIWQGVSSYKTIFTSSVQSAVYDIWRISKLGSLCPPRSARRLTVDEVLANPDEHRSWLREIGYDVSSLGGVQRNCEINLASVRWAQLNYLKMQQLYDAVEVGPLGEIPEDEVLSARASLARGPRSISPTDGVLCDACTLAPVCGWYREGLVCGVPKREYSKLAKTFGTRDAGVIIDGLIKLGEIQADRVAADLEEEEVTGRRSAETDRRLRMLTDHGIKTAKLIDPSLNGKGVQVNVGVVGAGGSTSVGIGGISRTPQELVSSMVRELEARGVPREDITGEAIMGLLEATTSARGEKLIEEVIDAEVIES